MAKTTITRNQIVNLHNDAIARGDRRLANNCLVALTCCRADGSVQPEYSDHSALAASVSAINDAETQKEPSWDDEGYWAACFGPTETRESVLAECESQRATPQDYARSCIYTAKDQGADFDADAAQKSLCHQLGVVPS